MANRTSEYDTGYTAGYAAGHAAGYAAGLVAERDTDLVAGPVVEYAILALYVTGSGDYLATGVEDIGIETLFGHIIRGEDDEEALRKKYGLAEELVFSSTIYTFFTAAARDVAMRLVTTAFRHADDNITLGTTECCFRALSQRELALLRSRAQLARQRLNSSATARQ